MDQSPGPSAPRAPLWTSSSSTRPRRQLSAGPARWFWPPLARGKVPGDRWRPSIVAVKETAWAWTGEEIGKDELFMMKWMKWADVSSLESKNTSCPALRILWPRPKERQTPRSRGRSDGRCNVPPVLPQVPWWLRWATYGQSEINAKSSKPWGCKLMQTKNLGDYGRFQQYESAQLQQFTLFTHQYFSMSSPHCLGPSACPAVPGFPRRPRTSSCAIWRCWCGGCGQLGQRTDLVERRGSPSTAAARPWR